MTKVSDPRGSSARLHGGLGLSGGEQSIENPFCRRRTQPPLRLGDYRRTAVLQAKMTPRRTFYRRRKVLQA